jgi:hypothetical protein
MAVKKSEIKSEKKAEKKSTSATPKVSRKKAMVDVAAAAPVVAVSVLSAPVVAAPVESARPGADEARVRARAHAIFQQHGGSALDNWLRAEREIGASA